MVVEKQTSAKMVHLGHAPRCKPIILYDALSAYVIVGTRPLTGHICYLLCAALIAKTFGKIAPGRAGGELPDDRLHEQPVALVAVAPDMAGAAWKQMLNSRNLIVAQCMASQRRPPSRSSHQSRFARVAPRAAVAVRP